MAINKKGKMEMSTLLVLGVIAWLVLGQGSLGGTSNDNGGDTIITSGTVVTVPTIDKLSRGTSISPTITYAIGADGLYQSFTSGTTTASPGTSLNFLLTNTSYHTVVLEGKTVPNSPTMTVTGSEMLKNSTSSSVQIYSVTSTAMTKTGTCPAATNQTTSGAGASYTHKIEFLGQDKTSTGDMLCVIEASDSTATQDMILSSNSGDWTIAKSSMGTPSIYSTAAGGLIRVYDVGAVTGAVTKTATLTVQSKTGQSLASGDSVTATCYSKEHFVDAGTGKLSYGIEDSLGTAKWVYKKAAAVCYQ